MEELESSAVQAPEQTAPGWYEGVTFEDAKIFIKSNIMSAARSFIAIGYYLKVVRDKEMYLEDGHATIWDFAKTEFGISMSTASRYMTMNDRFSKDGNSPVVADDYKEFGKSQLQEMLSLTDEQLEQVKPSDRVEDIRNMRKPKEIPYVAIPGQVELTDFPGIEPEDVAAASKATEEASASRPEKPTYTISAADLLPDPETQEPEQSIAISQQEPEPEVLHFTAGDRTIDNAYGATIAAVVRAYLDSGYVKAEKECEVTAFGLVYKVLKRQDVTVFYSDTGQTVFDVENARLEEEYQYWHGTKSEPEPAKQTPAEPEQDSCPPGITDCRRQEWGTEPEEPQEPLSAYGTPKRVYPEDSLIAIAGCEGGHSCTSCHVECVIRQEDCYCVDAPMGNPFPCKTLKVIQALRDEVGDRCQFVDNSLAYHRAGDHEPVPCCRECEEPCGYICDRAKKQLEAKANIPQDDTQQVDLDDEKLPDPDEKWSIGELPQAKESLVRQLARILIQDCGNELRMTPGELGCPSDDTIRKQTDMLVLSNNGFAALPDGVEAYPSEDMIEFFRGDEDLGVCSHARFATQVRRALEDADKAMLAGNRSSEVVHNAPRFKTEVQEPNLAETVIDGEFTEIPEPAEGASDQEAPMTELQIAQEELERAKRLLEKGLGCGVDENDIHIRRLKTVVCAWASYVCDLDSIVNPPPKPVQPELPLLKNNDQRAAFIDNYETCPLWIETAQTGERYYRYDLEDGTSMVVKVYHARLFDGYAPGSYDVQYHDGYGRHEYYLLQQGKFFRDCDTNRSLLIEKLKEIQKPKKG